MAPMTYEEACAFQKGLWSPERVRAAIACGDEGLQALRVENREKLASVGWTSEELCEEARRRMQVRIEELRKQEELERGS